MFSRMSVCLFILTLSSTVKAGDKIGISLTIGHPAFDRNIQGIQDTLEKNGIKKEDIIIQNAQGNPVLATQIAQMFSRDRRIAIPLGTIAAQAFLGLKKQKNFDVVFSSVTDPLRAGLVKSLEKPEANITGVSNNVAALKQLQFIKKVMGKQNLKIALLYNPSDANSISAVREVEEAVEKEALTLIKAPTIKLADMLSQVQKVLKEADLIFIHNDNLALSALGGILKIADKAKKPVFTSDVDTVTLGVLGALGADQYELGRQTAEKVLNILKGKRVSDIPVSYPERVIEKLNEAQAKKLGLSS